MHNHKQEAEVCASEPVFVCKSEKATLIEAPRKLESGTFAQFISRALGSLCGAHESRR